MNYPATELRGIRSVLPAYPESFFKNDSGQAGMTKVTKTIETPKQSFEELF